MTAAVPVMDKALVADLAAAEGVCIRPLLRRLVDRVTGEARTVVLPCRSTREAQCPPCAKRARALRMQQCHEGWHLTDEPQDPQPSEADEDQDDDLDGGDDDTEDEESERRVRSTKRRQDATDLPVKPVDQRTVGTAF